jgi:beta-phosphoglucomutase
MRVAACVFDLDGVIVDTARLHYLAWRRLCGELGFELTPADNERLKGVSRMDSLEILLELGGLELSALVKQGLAARKNGWYLELIAGLGPGDVLPGFLPLLERLESACVRSAVASSSANARLVLDRLGLGARFACCVDAQRVSRPKPHPELFLAAAGELGLSPAQCLVFEDGAAGVAAARAAGMRCVGVGDRRVLRAADWVVHSLADLDPAFVRDLVAGEPAERPESRT